MLLSRSIKPPGFQGCWGFYAIPNRQTIKSLSPKRSTRSPYTIPTPQNPQSSRLLRQVQLHDELRRLASAGAETKIPSNQEH